LLTADEAAGIAHLTPLAIARLGQAGRIPVCPTPDGLLFRLSDLVRYLEHRIRDQDPTAA